MTHAQETLLWLQNDLKEVGVKMQTPNLSPEEIAECRDRMDDIAAKFGMMQVLDEFQEEWELEELAAELERSQRPRRLPAILLGGLIGSFLAFRD